jgi:hypothetical protein
MVIGAECKSLAILCDCTVLHGTALTSRSPSRRHSGDWSLSDLNAVQRPVTHQHCK